MPEITEPGEKKLFACCKKSVMLSGLEFPVVTEPRTHPQTSFYIEFMANTVLFIVDLQLSRSQWCKVLQIFKVQKALSNLL